jgi:cobalt-zinc-cadmium efflux system outer membrane protein
MWRHARHCGLFGIWLAALAPTAWAADEAAPLPPAAVIQAQGGQYDLQQLTDLAAQNNPLLRRDLARIESARGLAVQAGLYPNPRFDTGNPQQLAGVSSVYNGGFIQPIVTKGKLKLDTQAALQAVRQAELAFFQDRFDLYTNVRTQFFSVLAAQRRVTVLKQLTQVVNDSLETGKKLEKAGEGNRIDVLLLTIEARRVQVSLQNAETLLRGGRRRLAAIVGLPDLPITLVSGDLNAPLPEIDEELVRQYVMSENTSVQNARVDIERNQILLRRAEVEPYPNIDLGAGYQYSVTPVHNQALIMVAFPIPAWNKNQGNIRAAQANIQESVETLGSTQNNLLGQAADAFSRHQAARELVRQYEEEILPNAADTLRLAQDGYAKGEFDFARYLQVQRTVVETNLSYISALESMWTTAAELAGLLQVERFP